MPTIRRRGKRWHAQVRIAGAGQRTKSFDCYQEAVDWARTEEAAAQEHARAERLGLHTLGDAIAYYMRVDLPNRSASTQVTTVNRLRWWHKCHGGRYLQDITPQLLANIRDELAAKSSASTANRDIAALSAVLAGAVERGWLVVNPARALRRLPEPQGRIRYLTPEERDRLLDACAEISDRLYAMVRLSLVTGMRQGELLALRWSQINLGRRTITLEITKNKRRRAVSLSSHAIAVLREIPRRVDTDFVFPGARKDQGGELQPITRSVVDVHWYRAIERAGLQGFRWHDMRHTFASYLAMAGATARELAEALGHTSIAMAMRYSHLSPQHVAGLFDRVGDALLGPAPEQAGPRRVAEEPP